MNRIKVKDYSGSYSAISAFNAFGVGVVIVGGIVALMGMAGASAASRYGGGPNLLTMIIAALPGAGIAIAGIFNLVFAKMAEASVHTAELTQELLRITVNNRDAANNSREEGRTSTQGSGVVASKEVPASPPPAPAPKKPRPLGGDNPAFAEGELVETYRDVDIYKRREGIFIGTQWYPGQAAAMKAIDEHKDGPSEE